MGLFSQGRLLADLSLNDLQQEEHGLEYIYNQYFGGGQGEGRIGGHGYRILVGQTLHQVYQGGFGPREDTLYRGRKYRRLGYYDGRNGVVEGVRNRGARILAQRWLVVNFIAV